MENHTNAPLHGKVAVVTNAARGIGRAVAETLGRRRERRRAMGLGPEHPRQRSRAVVAAPRSFDGSTAQLFVAVLASAVLLLTPALAHGQSLGEKAKLDNLVLFDGSRFDPQSIAGKVTLLYFWASWCPICRRELPLVEKHFLAYRDQGFTVLAINFRDQENDAKALLLDVAPIDFPVGVINDDYRRDYPKLYGTPTWYLIDRNGIIRKMVIGQSTITGGWFDGLKKELEASLADKTGE